MAETIVRRPPGQRVAALPLVASDTGLPPRGVRRLEGWGAMLGGVVGSRVMTGDPAELDNLLEAALNASGNERFDLLDEIRAHPALASLEVPESAGAAAVLLANSGDPSDLPNVARLSLVAHEGGIEGAGRIHAEASDKIALYTGRPQLYGTVMLEQNGEVVQPPVNPRVTDEERLALGVPTLAELHERMEQATIDLARERASKPGELPDGQRFCRVWTAPQPTELRARMATDGSAWADGDILTLVKETPVPFAVPPTFQLMSWPAGDGLQVLQVQIPRRRRAR